MARFDDFTEKERDLLHAGLTILADQLMEQQGGGSERLALLTQTLALREEIKREEKTR